MKKLLYLLPVSLLLCSCGMFSSMVVRLTLREARGTGDFLLLLYELFTTVLPLFLALMIQLPPKSYDAFEGSTVFALIVGFLSFITYSTSDDIAALISLAVIAGIPLVTRGVYGASWGRAFGTLGLFILFNFIAEFIAALIIDAYQSTQVLE